LFSSEVGKVSKNNHFIVVLLTANSIKVVFLINLSVSHCTAFELNKNILFILCLSLEASSQVFLDIHQFPKF
jgi:hypothetical protein